MALVKSDISNIRQVETGRADANRGVVAVIRIFYNLRGSGPFVVDIDKEGFTGQKAVDAVMKDAAERLLVIEAFEG